MTTPSTSSAELDRIYTHRVRVDLLDGIKAAESPTATIVRGQPGAGASYAAVRAGAALNAAVGTAAAISRSTLLEYHPHWRRLSLASRQVAAQASAEVDAWAVRLLDEATSRRVNIVVESGLSGGELKDVSTLAASFRAAGYQVSMVDVATDRHSSRQASMSRYQLARQAGMPAFGMGVTKHDTAYDELRRSLVQVEATYAVDRIQVVTHDGRQLYANHLQNATWTREPRAVLALDDFRERKRTAVELADGALHWDALIRRLSREPAAPAEVLALAGAWREEVWSLAREDRDAHARLKAGLEARSFLTMNRYDFERQFPQHAIHVRHLEAAIEFAEKNTADAGERRRFIDQARRRLAQRIAEPSPMRGKVEEKTPDPKTR